MHSDGIMIFVVTPEPKIILKFVQKTFPTEIKFDRRILNLIRISFILVRFPLLVKSHARRVALLSSLKLTHLVTMKQLHPHWNLDYIWIRVWWPYSLIFLKNCLDKISDQFSIWLEKLKFGWKTADRRLLFQAL